MKLLLDEMLSPRIARELRALGHDVAAIGEHPEWHAVSDAQALEIARRDHRAVVTNNLRDFRPLHHAAITPGGGGHFGMVFVPGGYSRTRSDTRRIVAALAALLVAHPGEADLVDGETWL